MFDTDVFIIGGGPAGIAAAIAARSRGFRVMVADGNRPPIDKACGEGLMPDSIAAASEIGIDLAGAEGYRFRGIRFHGDGYSVASDFPCGYGLGVRRTKLHALLIEQAAYRGAEMLWQAPVTGIGANEVRLRGRSVSTAGLSARMDRDRACASGPASAGFPAIPAALHTAGTSPANRGPSLWRSIGAKAARFT